MLNTRYTKYISTFSPLSLFSLFSLLYLFNVIYSIQAYTMNSNYGVVDYSTVGLRKYQLLNNSASWVEIHNSHPYKNIKIDSLQLGCLSPEREEGCYDFSLNTKSRYTCLDEGFENDDETSLDGYIFYFYPEYNKSKDDESNLIYTLDEGTLVKRKLYNYDIHVCKNPSFKILPKYKSQRTFNLSPFESVIMCGLNSVVFDKGGCDIVVSDFPYNSSTQSVDLYDNFDSLYFYDVPSYKINASQIYYEHSLLYNCTKIYDIDNVPEYEANYISHCYDDNEGRNYNEYDYKYDPSVFTVYGKSDFYDVPQEQSISLNGKLFEVPLMCKYPSPSVNGEREGDNVYYDNQEFIKGLPITQCLSSTSKGDILKCLRKVNSNKLDINLRNYKNTRNLVTSFVDYMGNGLLHLIYSDKPIYVGNVKYIDAGFTVGVLGVNVEHIIPQSYFRRYGEHNLHAGDLHTLFASSSILNSARANYEFVEIELDYYLYTTFFQSSISDKFNTWIKRDYHKKYVNYSKLYNREWEPISKSKGEVARAVAYARVYYGEEYSDILDTQTMKKWNNEDLPSEHEYERNIKAYMCQGNYNPFILMPELIDVLF